MNWGGENMFFRKINRNSKLEFIKRIEKIQKKLMVNGMHKINVDLDKVIDLMDNKLLELSDKQCNIINKCLETIENHCYKMYETLLIEKCDNLLLCISGKLDFDDACSQYIENEDRIYELLGELSNLDDQIFRIERRMEEVLKTDKNLWMILNSKKKNLQNKYRIINSNYQSLLVVQGNLMMSNQLEKTNVDCNEVIEKNESLNIYEIRDNATFIDLALKQVEDTRNEIENCISPLNSSNEYEYDLALVGNKETALNKEIKKTTN